MDKRTVEKIINNTPKLKQARDISNGLSSAGTSEAGKGSGRRPGDKQAYEDGWNRIFGKKEESDGTQSE